MKEIFYGKDGVAVIAEHNGSIIFVRQYRATANSEIVELPGGAVDEGETPSEAAIRELKEETGYIAESVEHILTFYSNPGISTNRIHIFKASCSSHSKCFEKIKVLRIKKDELQSRAFEDGKTILGLYLVGLKR